MNNLRLRSFFQFGTVNVLRSILGLIRSKFIALWFGSSGVGILGQYITFFNLQSKVIMFGATASMVSSYHMAEEKGWDRHRLLFYHFLFIFCANLIFIIFFLFHRASISSLVFGDQVSSQFLFLIILVGFLYSLAIYYEMIYQAKKEFGRLSLGRILSLIISIIVIVPLIYIFGLEGFLYDLMILYIFSFIFFFKKESLLRKNKLSFSKDKSMIFFVFKVSAIDVLRSILVLGSLLVVRVLIVRYLGMEKNGYIQSMWSIANYINVLSTGFMVYYFPMINLQKEMVMIREELNSSFSLLIYLLFPIILIILLLPNLFIKILYTKDFLIVSEYLKYFMIAKYIELYYYFYTTNFLGRNQFWNYLLLETLRSVFFIIIIWFFVPYFDIQGAAWAILSTEIFSFLVVNVILLKEKYLKLDKSNELIFFKILILLIITSVIKNFLLLIDFSRTILIFVFKS